MCAVGSAPPLHFHCTPSLGSSRPAPAGVRVNTLDPYGHGTDSFKPGKTFDPRNRSWTRPSGLCLGGWARRDEAQAQYLQRGATPIPDKVDDEAAGGKQRFSVLGTTVVAFFLAEMGDKTQIATVALAARYNDLLSVVAGTTIGMMLANVPAVFHGDTIAKKVSIRLVHGIAAVIFAALGLLTLFNVGNLF